MNDIQNEITEKCYLIKNDITIKNEITPKVAADFSVAFYKLFKDNYDEKLFINIIKKVMEFFNCAMMDFPNNSNSEKLKILINDIDTLKNPIEKIIVLKENDLNFLENKLLTETSEFYASEFKKLKKETNSFLSNKPFFLYRFSWKKKLKKKLIELLILERSITDSYTNIIQNNNEKNKILEEMFLEIKNNLKTFMIEVKPNIGKDLADTPYEYVMESQDDLKGFIFDIVISNFHQYSTLKKNV